MAKKDKERRSLGEFYTPESFVDKAHDIITAYLGDDWKERYVVWDCCCGTRNLTKKHTFSRLYNSTLRQDEIDSCHSPNTFQFDFLNDGLDKLPDQLINDLRADRPILFFINPPYAAASNRDETSKDGVAKTAVNAEMLSNGMGRCSQNLYIQFMYNIVSIKQKFRLSNCRIALFSPTLFLSGSSCEKFRKVFLKEFAFDYGMQFKASYFDDCADNWGISFTMWHSGETECKNSFKCTLVDLVDGKVPDCGEKIIYNTDGLVTASDWAKEPVKGLKTFDVPNLSSGITVRDKPNNLGRNFQNNLGYFNNGGNNVDQNMQMVALFSSAYGNGHGHGINADNFDRCAALFAARKLVDKNWVNSKDEYLVPNIEYPKWGEFVNDSLVFSLFHSSANQSSLRNIEYRGSKWDVKNEWFFMSRGAISQMAFNCGNSQCLHDCISGTDERFMYKHMQGRDLSDEASLVLSFGMRIVTETFMFREVFDKDHPEYQVNNWDAGFYQVKAMCKECCPGLLKNFNEVFRRLSDKMRPMVYELGFLK